MTQGAAASAATLRPSPVSLCMRGKRVARLSSPAMGGLWGKALGASTAVAAMLAIALPAPAGAVSASDTCRAQDTEILEKADIKLAERSMLCLLNVHRVAQGVPPLPWDPNLAASARKHSKDMVERHYNATSTPTGVTRRRERPPTATRRGGREHCLAASGDRRQSDRLLPRLAGDRRQRPEHAGRAQRGCGDRVRARHARKGDSRVRQPPRTSVASDSRRELHRRSTC